MATDQEVGTAAGGMKKFALLATPDNMDHWKDCWQKEAAGQIWTVYIIDLSERTYCCELKPSYWLEYLDSFCENDFGDEDKKRDDIWDWMRDAQISCDPSHYSHCDWIDLRVSQIEIRSQPNPWLAGRNFMWIGEFEDIEEARDYWQGNPPFPPISL